MFNWKVFLAEFIGTFALVFIGAGSAVVGSGVVGVALAHGLTLAVFAYAFGHISGTHVNPAVTFGLALNGTVKWAQAVVYWIAQFAGAIAAAAVLHYSVDSVGASINSGLTVGRFTLEQPIWAMVIELILTFFLVNTILHTAVAGKGGNMAGWAIGMTLSLAILVGGPLTGASLNPARTLGPAIFGDQGLTDVYTYIIYFFGPLIGATLAVMAFNFFQTEEEEEDDEMEPEPVIEEVAAKKATRKPAVRKAATRTKK
jgi:MIP family channel proteins